MQPELLALISFPGIDMVGAKGGRDYAKKRNFGILKPLSQMIEKSVGTRLERGGKHGTGSGKERV